MGASLVTPCTSWHQSDHPWFAVELCHQKYTQPALTLLRQKGYEAFTPFQNIIRQSLKRRSELRVPVFPGYLFVQLDLRYRLPILTTPGVRRLVGYGHHPIPLCREEVSAIRRITDSGVPAESDSFMREGEPVKLIAGPLAGVTGILISDARPNRLLIRVTLIQRAISISVNSDWVRRLGQPMGQDESQSPMHKPAAMAAGIGR